MGTFAARMEKLAEMVGDGDLVGKLVVDQRYAAPHERGFWVSGPNAGVQIRNHPQGGKEHFLRDPLLERGPTEYTQRLARMALQEHGLLRAMAENMEDLDRAMHGQAPHLFGDLRNSGHPTVTDQGRLVYNRAPRRHRLTEGALREKSRRNRLGEGPGPGRRRR